ncbi:hypothetical protein HYV79_00345 [Candidatus Woesearchaeota archaeon]|nr:hypothetical protein [Candidatus Woesearchaeota archaeon]
MDLNKIKELNELTKRMRENPALNVAKQTIVEREQNTNVHQETQSNTAFLEKKMQVLLDMSTKQFKNEFSQLSEKISLLQDQVSMLQQNVAKLQYSQKTEQSPQQQTSQQQKQQNSTPPQKEPIPLPPQNTVKLEEVSIEKFFYFGKK